MVPWGDWTPSAVAVDIDGTLTDGNRILDGDALRALKRLEEAGIPVILATGNVRPVAYGLWRFSGLSGPMVCENGGVVWHPDWDAPLLMGDARRAQAASIGSPPGSRDSIRRESPRMLEGDGVVPRTGWAPSTESVRNSQPHPTRSRDRTNRIRDPRDGTGSRRRTD